MRIEVRRLGSGLQATLTGSGTTYYGYALANAGDWDEDGYEELLVGAPANFTNDESYQLFMDAHANRTKMVYVGSNDGMLHAFRAGPNCSPSTAGCPETGGEELWGFVPFDQLGALSEEMGFHFEMERIGKPSRWNTLRALRVLQWWDA